MDELFDETLVDPDAGDEVTTYSWDEEFQRHIIALLVSDRQFLLQSIDLVKPTYFTNKAHQKMCGIAYAFFKRYGMMPKKELLIQEMKDSLKDNKSLAYYIGEVNVVFDYFEPGLDARDYLQDKITYFAKIQVLKNAFHNSLKEIDRSPESEETWGKVYEMMRKAMTTQENFELGIDYFKDFRARYNKSAEEEATTDRYTTGLLEVDQEIKGGGYSRGEIISVVAGSGVGKCFSKDTPVLMFDGRTKAIQDISVGDVVMGDDSTPRRVLRTHSGHDEMYDIVPVKGDKYTVNSRHTLVLKSSSKSIAKKDRCANPRYWGSEYHIGNGMFEIEVRDLLQQSVRFQKTLKGYRSGVDFSSKEVRIDPYVLGVWLGDGTERTTDFTVSNSVIVEELQKEADNRGLKLNPKEDRGEATTYSITTGYNEGHGAGSNSLRNDFKHYNLFENKHVPENYRTNSREVRLQLLAGLIDTDGAKSNNCFDFVNKNKQLAEDVVFISRSLGFAAYMSPCEKSSQNGTVGQYWRVTISGDLCCVPVRILYKHCSPRKQVKDSLVTGIEVVPVGHGQYFGFETDGNHRFLLGDFTVVHNSVMLANITATNLLRGKKGVYISCELVDYKVAERMDSILTDLPIQSLSDHKDDIFEKLESFEEVDYDNMFFVIKHFAAGTLTVNMVRAYLAQLRFHGFDPDFLVVDYVGEMAAIPGLPTHESRETIVRDLRGLAFEENLFVATAMQPNRDSRETQKTERGRIEEEHLADSFGQIRPLDGCFSLNQNDTENQLGLGRGYVIKQRDGKSRYQIYLRFNKETLRITQIARETYRTELHNHKETVSEDVKVDHIVENQWPTEDGPDDPEPDSSKK
jgi:KaiC/GvpD/RAD55 family RecA-like ATPase